MSQDNYLQERLDALPRKVAFPLRQLLAAGQLSDEVVATVLDAGELAGEHTRLVGFAAGFLHLASQGVPVRDVIRMAKHQQRRIHLGWSAQRWKREHDRLSRVEALARLDHANVHYDVAEYASLLPERFAGYLIRTSRRLGMEGLRQRHCVASYHDRLQAGHCAIASVFVGGQRWTVELVSTNNPETPLRIQQIKTRFNGLPTGQVRQQIHEMLGIDPKNQAEIRPRPAAAERVYMDTLRRLLPVLRAHGAAQVVVSFDGYGDSGSIQDIGYAPHERTDTVSAAVVEYLSVNTYWDDGQWQRVRDRVHGSVNDAIEQLTYDYLEETDVDWYNNDGGFGELVIDVESGTVVLEVNVRYTNHQVEFSAERDIATGEEV